MLRHLLQVVDPNRHGEGQPPGAVGTMQYLTENVWLKHLNTIRYVDCTHLCSYLLQVAVNRALSGSQRLLRTLLTQVAT
jgi:hypothetical protein